MSGMELLSALGGVRAEFVEAADAEIPVGAHRNRAAGTSRNARTKSRRIVLTIRELLPVAACVLVCLTMLSGWALFRKTGGFASGSSDSFSASSVAAPFDRIRLFSDERESLEAEGVIPVLADYPMFYAEGQYFEDGSLYRVRLNWHRQAEDSELPWEEWRALYGNLVVYLAPEAAPEPSDTAHLLRDEAGDEVPYPVTVAERDGIPVTVEGYEEDERKMTWEKDGVWYQVVGSWGDTTEEMEALRDWFWDHPADLSRFELSRGSAPPSHS